MNKPKTVFFILGLIASFVGGYFYAKKNVIIPEPEVFVEVEYRTIRDTVPIPRYEFVVRTEIDTLYLEGDTVKVPVFIPITQKEYKTDSYIAWVSGHKPNLDSIFIKQKEVTITRREFVPLPSPTKTSLGVKGETFFINNKLYPAAGIYFESRLQDKTLLGLEGGYTYSEKFNPYFSAYFKYEFINK